MNNSQSQKGDYRLTQDIADYNKENRKMGLRLFGGVLLAGIVCLIFYSTFSTFFYYMTTSKVGERIIETNQETGERQIIAEVYYEDIPDGTNPDEKDSALVQDELKDNQRFEYMRSVQPQVPKFIFDTVFQLVLFFILFYMIYSPMWFLGDKDAGRIKYSDVYNKKYRGFILGVFAAIPSLILFVILVFCRLGYVGADYMAFFRILNAVTMPMFSAFANYGSDPNSLNFFEMFLVGLTTVLIPVFSQLGYWLGKKSISFSDKFLYKKPRERR